MVTEEVKKAILHFVQDGRSFISLDIYSYLGKHFNDDENPIFEQVREAYINGTMPNYLCRWANLRLEGGGQATVWKYYLPDKSYQDYDLIAKADGEFELSKKILGPLALLELNVACCISDKKIEYLLPEEAKEKEMFIANAANKLVISKSLLKKANLSLEKKLKARIYPNRVEIYPEKK
jgi:hypothetical protein